MAELKALICKSSGCHYFDGFGCTRSGVVGDNDEKMPCDKGERTMKIGDKVWVPVTVTELDNDGTTRVEYDRATEAFWVDNKEIQTVTAEDYRNALNEFYQMFAKERSEIWGLSLFSDAFQTTAEEFVGRLRKYQDKPKTGQIWKSSTGLKIVIHRADESEVHYFTPSGYQTWCGRNYFNNTFHNTGEVLTSIATFMKDLEGLNEKR